MGILQDLKDFFGIRSPRVISPEEKNAYAREQGRLRAQKDWERNEKIRREKEAHIKKLQKYGFQGVCEGRFK